MYIVDTTTSFVTTTSDEWLLCLEQQTWMQVKTKTQAQNPGACVLVRGLAKRGGERGGGLVLHWHVVNLPGLRGK